MDTIVRQYSGCRQVLALRRAMLAYAYLSFILDGLGRRHPVGQPGDLTS